MWKSLTKVNHTKKVLKLCEEMLHTKTKPLYFANVNHLKPNMVSTQENLPHLPVPPLDNTLQKLLRTVRPLVNDSEYAATEDAVKQFGSSGGVGVKLQKLLEDRAKCQENWMSDWWLNAAYMDFRWPVVMWSSPGLVFPHQTFKSGDDQLLTAAKVIAAAAQYKLIVDQNKIPQEKMGKDLLDMAQYHKILGTCRIPGIKRDSLYFLDPCDPPRHIVVVHNNHFFELDIFDENNIPLTEEQLVAQLKKVIECSSCLADPVGIMTSENRDTWGKVYDKLGKDPVNATCLDSIKKSLFLMCIDGPNPVLANVNKDTMAALQTVHGCGSRYNAGNRWYDKTIQFIVGTNGELGLTYEHSPAEGPPIAFLMDFIMEYINKSPSSSITAKSFSSPKKLEFSVSSEIKEAIKNAEKNMDSMVHDLEMSCGKFEGYGKEFIKTQKLSPDSFIQMAIQLAFYRIHSLPGAHYESASTRKFIHGRTETIRSCSIESLLFAKSMMDPSVSDQEKATALRNAVNSHKNYTVDAINGLGVDRHLLGLKLIAQENGIQVPSLYQDAGYVRSSHMRISTSQVAARCSGFMCYGPLVTDGYACCYNPRSNEILYGTSALNSCAETSAHKFKNALDQSFSDMQSVLVKTQKSKL